MFLLEPCMPPEVPGGIVRDCKRLPGNRIAGWLVNPAYGRLWAGQAVSAAGDSVFTVTVMVWVSGQIAAGRPWAAAAVACVPASAFAAVAVAGPLSAAVVDRFDRRALMTATELARAGVAAALAAVSFLPAGVLPVAAQLAVLYASVAALSAAGQLFMPAQVAMTAAIVPGEADRVRAAGLGEAAWAAAGIVGPAIAAPLMLAAGVRGALIANAASYAVSWLSVRSLPSSPPGRAGLGLRGELAEGLRAFAASRVRILLAVTMTAQLGTGTVTALTATAVTVGLHGTPRTFLAAEMAMGAGYIAGAAVAGRAVATAGLKAVTWSGLLAAGVLAAGFALASDVPEGLAVLGGYAAAIGALNTATGPLLMSAAPPETLGRVMSLFGPANRAAGAAAMLAAGWLAGLLDRARPAGSAGGVSLVLLAGAGMLIAAGVLAAVILPREMPARRRPGPERTAPRRIAAAR
jgi:MFS family permease